MDLNFQEVENINTVSEFQKLMRTNIHLKKLPTEIKEAVIKKELSLDILKELIKVKDKRVYEKVVTVIERKKNYEKNILTTAKMAVKRSYQMKNKMMSLNKILEEGVILSSVWDIGKRKEYAGDSSFWGNAPTQVIEQCIMRLTEKYDTVLDVMAGSGTSIDVCKALSRKFIAYDLSPIRSDIIKNDSKTLPLNDESVDMIFVHPPYWNMVKYSTNDNDLSRQSLEDFLKSIEQILSDCKRVLKKGKYISILIGDLVEDGKFIPLSRKIANIAENIGLQDCGNAIKLTTNSVSQIRRGKTIYAEVAKTRNLKINHDIVMFWKKIN